MSEHPSFTVVFKLSPCSECSKYSFGNFPASEVYKPTFWNSVSVPSSWASRNNTRLWVGGKYTGTEIRGRANEEVGLIGEERVVRAGSISTG